MAQEFYDNFTIGASNWTNNGLNSMSIVSNKLRLIANTNTFSDFDNSNASHTLTKQLDGDFSVEAKVTYTGVASNLAEIFLRLEDADGNYVHAGLQDGRAADTPSFRSRINSIYVDTNKYTMPMSGTNVIRITRHNNIVKFFMDGTEVHSGSFTGIITKVLLTNTKFQTYAGTTADWDYVSVKTGSVLLDLDMETLEDYSGNKSIVENNGTVGAYGPSVPKDAREFNGSSSSITVDSYAGSSELSVRVRIKPYSNSANAILGFDNEDASQRNWYMDLNSGILRVMLGTGGNNKVWTNCGSIPAGVWSDIVLTFNSSREVNTYINGNHDKSWTHTTDLQTYDVPLYLGRNTRAAYPSWFNGIQDSFKVFKRALTSIEADNLYNNKTISTVDLEVDINLESLEDDSINSYTIIDSDTVLGYSSTAEITVREFNGSTSYIDSKINMSSRDYSVYCKAYWNNIGPVNEDQALSTWDGTNGGWFIGSDGSNVKINVYMDSAWRISFVDTGITTGNYYGLTLTFDSVNRVVKYYRDGVLKATSAAISTFTHPVKPIFFGNQPNNTTRGLNGKISVAKIWNSVLSLADVVDMNNDIYPTNNVVFDLNMATLENEAGSAINFGTALTTGRGNKANTARSFDGTDSVNIQDFKIQNGTSLRFWYSSTQLSVNRRFFSKGTGSSAPDYDIIVAYKSTGAYEMFIGAGGSSYKRLYGGAVDNTGVWTMVTIVINTIDDIKLYHNGSEVTLTVSSGGSPTSFVNSGAPLLIGADTYYPTLYYIGKQEGYKIWNNSLTDTDIKMDYVEAKHNYVDLFDGLVAGHDFRGNAKDFSGNGHDGTVTGATLVPDQFGIQDSMFHFDGNDRIFAPYNSTNDSEGTVITVFRATDVSQDRAIFTFGDASDTDGIFIFGTNSSKIRMYFNENSSDIRRIFSTNTLSNNTFHSASVSSDGSSYHIDIDGEEEVLNVSTGSNNGDWLNTVTIATPDRIGIGVNADSTPANYFVGDISCALYFNKYKTPEQRKAITELLSKGYIYPYPKETKGGITQ